VFCGLLAKPDEKYANSYWLPDCVLSVLKVFRDFDVILDKEFESCTLANSAVNL
jgi:hypothetical protein